MRRCPLHLTDEALPGCLAIALERHASREYLRDFKGRVSAARLC
jgi:hypothetical protein